MEKKHQLRFSVLRIQADLPSLEEIEKRYDRELLKKNPDQSIINDLLHKMKLKNYWKRDESVHDLAFNLEKELIEIENHPTPKPPRGFLGLYKPKSLAAYNKLIDEHEQRLSRKSEIESQLNIFKKIKELNKNTCYFCNFENDPFIEIHHLNGDHEDNSESNLTTACRLCHRQHHLLWLSQYDHAELGIASNLPIDQKTLNHLQRISMVFSDSETHKNSLGLKGKLGAAISEISTNFSRPLYYFLIPEEERNNRWETYISNGKNKIDGTHYYSVLEKAVQLLKDGAALEGKENESIIQEYDGYICAQKIVEDHNLSNQQKITINDARLLKADYVSEKLKKFKMDFEKLENDTFQKSVDTFSIFELAFALSSIQYDSFKDFKPQGLYLIFKSGIYSDEELKVYREMDYFNINKWRIGDDKPKATE
ncbi:hypothetical protein A7M79_07210 [Acinetobacter baumannii]|uniref:HNH endonuclease signature motif containing protein n=1 Tax=Acinetobacter baumannii TaxID=470 RepID=UPI0008DE42CA|nr:HNH endonuclease signature motif containing protein [Acinetobacter baumannii]OIH08595.1 hypothetical protein A7M79_07210 [Acinetobacter baumannii]